MKACEVCHNEYDKIFEVRRGEEIHFFDSFECAIQLMAPVCSHCRCRIIGHGLEAGEQYYCCAHCAKEEGESRVRDRAEEGPRYATGS